jgi:hypothetical protein
MITRLQKLETQISTVEEIPEMFFREIENSANFGIHLFPPLMVDVFGTTSLMNKFEAVYIKYKAIRTKAKRALIIAAFTNNNQIENICNNQPGLLAIELNNLPKSIIRELDALFSHLYNNSINYHLFEEHVTDKLKKSITRFITTNELEVCPFCGLEGFLNLEGQARIALDHWLCRDLFPMVAVNFDNLFPIGHDCNTRPAKGSKNILIDNPITRNRVKAFYPYSNHSGVNTSFHFINEPTIKGITDIDWKLILTPTNPLEQDIFNSWDSTLNINIRYLDYFRKNIFPMWEKRYKNYVERNPHLNPADNIEELKDNFRHWKATFDVKVIPGSIVYIPFIDFLINNASDGYLYGLCENFKR